MSPAGGEGVTVDELLPILVRAASNGNASGAGMRLYIPKRVCDELSLEKGQTFRVVVLDSGRMRLVPVDVGVGGRKAYPGDVELPADRIALHVTQEEAQALEATLATGARVDRGHSLRMGKRLRRRMRAHGWTTPDRTMDKVELMP